MRPVLVVVGGLPATGKSSIAAALAARTGTTYFRVDRVEQALVAWSSLSHPVGPVGYAVVHQLAREQLGLRLDVIVECVNPTAATRDPWAGTAAAGNAVLLEVEVVCSDVAEHRRRVETRPTDVEGLVKPSWAEVVGREYEPWGRELLTLDSARTPVAEAADRLVEAMRVARLGPNVLRGDERPRPAPGSG